jgi:hypothetical protein
VLIASRWSGRRVMYAALARVLEHSAVEHNPDAVVDVANTGDGDITRSEAFVRKARDWLECIGSAPHDELVLLDTDMLVTGSLADPFAVPGWDIAVTTGGGIRALNSGVLFVRRSDRVLRALRRWPELTARWCRRNVDAVRYGDQDALIEILIATACTYPAGLRILELDRRRWNAQQHCWDPLHPDVRLIHVKSDARRLIFGGVPHGQPGAGAAADRWLAAARAAGVDVDRLGGGAYPTTRSA